MMTETDSRAIAAWFGGRLPAEWTAESQPEITVDREEIVVRVRLAEPPSGDDQDEDERSAAAEGRLAAWREETRASRMQIADEAQRRFGRTVSWGARLGDESVLFTHLAVPVMTRLRQRQRLVLDTLVDAGVARSRADAVQWCVALVGEHTSDWLDELQGALKQVHEVRDRGPEV